MIHKRIESGRYLSASEVVQEALELLDKHDRHTRWLRAELQIGLDQEARGELVDWTPDFMQRLMREADERTRVRLPIKDAVKP